MSQFTLGDAVHVFQQFLQYFQIHDDWNFVTGAAGRDKWRSFWVQNMDWVPVNFVTCHEEVHPKLIAAMGEDVKPGGGPVRVGRG